MPKVKLSLSQDPEADRRLSDDPLALLIGMVLDQQIPLEWAFKGPAELARRLAGKVDVGPGGRLDAAAIAALDPETLAAAFSSRPALHRYPGSMAARVQALCQIVADDYGNDAANVWKGAADGADLLRRVKALPGFGEQKARIFVALLGKQLRVTPEGWQKASSPFGDPGTYQSVADIVDGQTLDKVRAYKQAKKKAMKAAPQA